MREPYHLHLLTNLLLGLKVLNDFIGCPLFFFPPILSVVHIDT